MAECAKTGPGALLDVPAPLPVCGMRYRNANKTYDTVAQNDEKNLMILIVTYGRSLFAAPPTI
jgi:hypothetical protein